MMDRKPVKKAAKSKPAVKPTKPAVKASTTKAAAKKSAAGKPAIKKAAVVAAAPRQSAAKKAVTKKAVTGTKPAPAKKAAEKAPAKKTLAKKGGARKAPAKKPAAKKPVARKAPAKKAVAAAKKPVAAKNPAAKKTVVKRMIVKKPVVKKSVVKKPVSRKPAASKAPTPTAFAAPKTSGVGTPNVSSVRPGRGQAQAAPAVAETQPAGGGSRMVLMLRDPRWLCVYWDLDAVDVKRHRVGALVGGPLLLVRLHRDGGPAHDFTVFGQARTWYIPIEEPSVGYTAELGYIGASGSFVTVVRSNRLEPPQPKPKPVTVVKVPVGGPVADPAPTETPLPTRDEAGWVAPDPEPAEYWATPVAPLASAPTGALADLPMLMESPEPPESPPGSSEQRRLPSGAAVPGGASEAMAPPGAGAPLGASEMLPGILEALKPPAGQRGFWLRVATELILYGATEPDARLTVAGEPVALRPDGTFTLRYALPDGRMELPVRAVSADGQDERSATPVVEKQTH
jgi:hypothetical protein